MLDRWSCQAPPWRPGHRPGLRLASEKEGILSLTSTGIEPVPASSSAAAGVLTSTALRSSTAAEPSRTARATETVRRMASGVGSSRTTSRESGAVEPGHNAGGQVASASHDDRVLGEQAHAGSGAASVDRLTWMISDKMDTAISSSVSACISIPIGVWTRSTSRAPTPASASLAATVLQRVVLPITPMYRAGLANASEAGPPRPDRHS